MPDLRRDRRYECHIDAVVEVGQFGVVPCTIVNVSLAGLAAIVDSTVQLRIDDIIAVRHPSFGRVQGTVRWLGMSQFGLEFRDPLTQDSLTKLLS